MDNLPVADELASFGFDLSGGASILEEYKPLKDGALAKQVASAVSKEKDILDYRNKQGLILTEVQAKLLGAISDRKIQEASLRDLVNSYKVLKDKELLMDGKPTEIKGFVGYLMALEQEDKEEKLIVINPGDITQDDETNSNS